MRVADSLALPTELEAARAANALVVFAGAGVSMGEPACIPSFDELARKIAEGRIPWQEDDAKALGWLKYFATENGTGHGSVH